MTRAPLPTPSGSPLVYLAGPITGLSFDGATDWRATAIEGLAAHGIRGLSPMRAKEYLGGETYIATEYAASALSCAKGITTRDRWDCGRSDVVLVNLLGAAKVSIGTVMEVAWADSHRRPVILVMEDGNVHDHPMLRESAGFILPSLDEAISIAVALLA